MCFCDRIVIVFLTFAFHERQTVVKFQTPIQKQSTSMNGPRVPKISVTSTASFICEIAFVHLRISNKILSTLSHIDYEASTINDSWKHVFILQIIHGINNGNLATKFR